MKRKTKVVEPTPAQANKDVAGKLRVSALELIDQCRVILAMPTRETVEARVGPGGTIVIQITRPINFRLDDVALLSSTANDMRWVADLLDSASGPCQPTRAANAERALHLVDPGPSQPA